MRIKSKLVTTFSAVSLLGLTFVSLFFFFYVNKILTSEVLRRLETVSSLQKHRIEGIIEQNLERIRLVTSRTQLRISLHRYLQSRHPKDYKKLQLILNDARKSIASFNVISILNKQGKVLVSTNSARLGKNYSGYDFYVNAKKHNSAKDFFINENSELRLYLAGPLIIDDVLIGVLLIEANANNVITLVTDFSGLGRSGETELGSITRDGRYAKFLTPMRFEKDAALKRTVSLDRTTSPLVNTLLQRPLSDVMIDYRGKEVLAGGSVIAQTGWGLVVKLDKDEALRPGQVLLKYLFVLGLAVMIIVIMVSYIIAGIISRPVVALTNVAREINDGNFVHRSDVHSKDEIGVLATTFNNMTDNLIDTQYNLEKTNRELHSHRDHLNEMVALRTRELQTSIDELESFSYSVSHDLRTPLRALDGYSYLLLEKLDGVLDEEDKTHFQRIRLAAQRMGALIDDLLKLSRINRRDVVREKVNLSDRVELALSKLNQLQGQRPLEYIVQPDLIVEADLALLGIAIDNLIDNAWKYTGHNTNARIEFGATEQDGQTVYFVRDNGIGFDMQYADKMFAPFQRLVRDEDYPGTGIGLATVLRVIKRHGGRLWAESKPGKGATFYFTVSQA